MPEVFDKTKAGELTLSNNAFTVAFGQGGSKWGQRLKRSFSDKFDLGFFVASPK